MPTFIEVPTSKRGGLAEWSPEELGINSASMKSALNTNFDSPLIDFSGYRQFSAYLKLVQVGTSTAGRADLTILPFAYDGTTALHTGWLIRQWTLPTAAGTNYMTLGWALERSLNDVVTSGTAAGTSQSEAMRTAGKCKVRLTVGVQSDAATSALMTVYFRAGF